VEDVIPTIFVTHHPSAGIRAGDRVFFRLWPQGGEVGPISVDFGDGRKLESLAPYAEVDHTFTTAGIHVVTAAATVGVMPITQKVKVVVER
jgi:hypothetical protein